MTVREVFLLYAEDSNWKHEAIPKQGIKNPPRLQFDFPIVQGALSK